MTLKEDGNDHSEGFRSIWRSHVLRARWRSWYCFEAIFLAWTSKWSNIDVRIIKETFLFEGFSNIDNAKTDIKAKAFNDWMEVLIKADKIDMFQKRKNKICCKGRLRSLILMFGTAETEKSDDLNLHLVDVPHTEWPKVDNTTLKRRQHNPASGPALQMVDVIFFYINMRDTPQKLCMAGWTGVKKKFCRERRT